MILRWVKNTRILPLVLRLPNFKSAAMNDPWNKETIEHKGFGLLIQFLIPDSLRPLITKPFPAVFLIFGKTAFEIINL